LRGLVFGAALVACPVVAEAVDNWTIYDLGQSRRLSICMTAAERAFVEYDAVYSTDRIEKSNWVVFGWNLNDSGQDAIITCADGPGGGSQATIVMYGANSALIRMEAERLGRLFIDANEEIGKAYVEDALRRFGF